MMKKPLENKGMKAVPNTKTTAKPGSAPKGIAKPAKK